MHNEGKGAKYTRGRTPVKVVAAVSGISKVDAMRIERQVKKLPRNQKEEFLKYALGKPPLDMAKLDDEYGPEPDL